jgi:hypothetical protein
MQDNVTGSPLYITQSVTYSSGQISPSSQDGSQHIPKGHVVVVVISTPVGQQHGKP